MEGEREREKEIKREKDSPRVKHFERENYNTRGVRGKFRQTAG